MSIRNVPYGFTNTNEVDSVSIADEIHVTAKNNVTNIDIVVTDNIFKE